jgi:hypothetical protein
MIMAEQRSVNCRPEDSGNGMQIRIRGGTSISASNDPLYVIDGVPIQNDQTEATGLAIGGGGAGLNSTFSVAVDTTVHPDLDLVATRLACARRHLH